MRSARAATLRTRSRPDATLLAATRLIANIEPDEIENTVVSTAASATSVWSLLLHQTPGVPGRRQCSLSLPAFPGRSQRLEPSCLIMTKLQTAARAGMGKESSMGNVASLAMTGIGLCELHLGGEFLDACLGTDLEEGKGDEVLFVVVVKTKDWSCEHDGG